MYDEDGAREDVATILSDLLASQRHNDAEL